MSYNIERNKRTGLYTIVKINIFNESKNIMGLDCVK